MPKEVPETFRSLDHLMEECGAVVQIIGKTRIYGLGSFDPEVPGPEREMNGDAAQRRLKKLISVALVAKAELEKAGYPG